MPIMQPKRIKTRGKNSLYALWIWLFRVRRWTLTEDFYFSFKDKRLVIPKGFEFNGASVPRMFWWLLSPTGILLVGGIIHDFGYKYGTLMTADKKSSLGQLHQKDVDIIFRTVNIDNNGFFILNWISYFMIRIFGFIAWNRHRSRNLKLFQDFPQN